MNTGRFVRARSRRRLSSRFASGVPRSVMSPCVALSIRGVSCACAPLRFGVGMLPACSSSVRSSILSTASLNRPSPSVTLTSSIVSPAQCDVRTSYLVVLLWLSLRRRPSFLTVVLRWPCVRIQVLSLYERTGLCALVPGAHWVASL